VKETRGGFKIWKELNFSFLGKGTIGKYELIKKGYGCQAPALRGEAARALKKQLG